MDQFWAKMEDENGDTAEKHQNGTKLNHRLLNYILKQWSEQTTYTKTAR